MTAVLYRIARFCVAHRVAVLAVWIAGAAALVVVSHQLGDRKATAQVQAPACGWRHVRVAFSNQGHGNAGRA